MTSRKKIAISITAVCVVLLVAVVTIVAVWAATRTNVNNSFQGNYTANHVNAKVTAQYKIGGTDAFDDDSDWNTINAAAGGTEITFDAEDVTDGSGSTESFAAVNNVVLNSANKNIMFKYVITNPSTVGEESTSNTITFTVTSNDFDNSGFTNMTCTTTYRLSGNQDAALAFTPGTTSVKVAPGQSVTIYVNIAIDNVDKNASFESSVSFTLTSEEPSAGVGA